MTKHSDKLAASLPSSESFELDDFPFYWVARVNARYALEMETTLKAMNMDISRWRVAMLLNVHGEMSISDIAEQALGKLPTITKIVYRMRDEGLVNVYPSELDGRVSLVRLTELGYENVTRVFTNTQAVFEKAFKGFSEPQIRKLNTLLIKLFNNLG